MTTYVLPRRYVGTKVPARRFLRRRKPENHWGRGKRLVPSKVALKSVQQSEPFPPSLQNGVGIAFCAPSRGRDRVSLPRQAVGAKKDVTALGDCSPLSMPPQSPCEKSPWFSPKESSLPSPPRGGSSSRFPALTPYAYGTSNPTVDCNMGGRGSGASAIDRIRDCDHVHYAAP